MILTIFSCPLVSFSLPFLGALFLKSFAGFHHKLSIMLFHLHVLQAMSQLYWLSIIRLQEPMRAMNQNVSHHKITCPFFMRTCVPNIFNMINNRCQVGPILGLSPCPGVKDIFSKPLASLQCKLLDLVTKK